MEREIIAEQKRAGRRKRALIFFFLSGLLVASWNARIPDMQLRLDLDNASLGNVLAAVPLGLMTGLSLAGWLVARFGTIKISIVTCIISAILLALAGFSQTTAQLVIILFLIGCFRTIFNISINTNAMEVQKHYEKPIIALFHGTWSFACFVAMGFAALLMAMNVIPAVHFVVIALVVIAGVVIFSFSTEEKHSVPDKRPFFVKPDRYLFILGLIALCTMFAEGAMFDWSINYFDKVVNAKKEFITTGYIAFIIAMAGGRLLGDRIIAWFGLIPVILINGCIMAAGFLIAATFPFLLPAAIGFFLVGIGDSILVPVIYMLAANSKKMPAGYAIASVTMIGYTGFLIAPVVIGFVSEYAGMRTAFALIFVVSLFVVAFALVLKKIKTV